ncbi:MAG: lipid-A-disaccharide synthase [Bacteroidaceae bacterium]|nr:lipid-A-disaccharide synthase [Bacteroidaceae bacterium]
MKRPHRYYLIAGEASGDLHASHLIAAIREQDPQAEFRCFGGDKMREQGATLVRHYRDLAYMGAIQVLLHLQTILDGMRQCQSDILSWKPDALILVDYPGFNLKIANYIKQHARIPIFYFIAPKIWAWKEDRIRAIRRDVDKVLSILPFEVEYFQNRHQYPVTYVGNPSADEVAAFKEANPHDFPQFVTDNHLSGKPIIALLAGSRRQEIDGNLQRMLAAAAPYTSDYELVIAAAPGFDDDFYLPLVGKTPARILHDQTFRILQYSTAAMVTSGTATLETALFGVPQVVCYFTFWRKIANWVKPHLLRVPYISLVNLIVDAPVVPELIGADMNVPTLRRHLQSILPEGKARESQLQGYAQMMTRLGQLGAPHHAAEAILKSL